MSILWCGGEDSSFPNGGVMVVNNACYRSGFARCAVYAADNGAPCKSVTFAGITSGWASCRIFITTFSNGQKCFGFGSSIANSGIFLAGHATISGKLSLIKLDAGVVTVLASEPGVSLASGVLHRVDIQLVSYGASSTVNVWLDGVQVISYTGSTALAGVSNLDQVWICQYYGSTSEVMVADEDLRAWPGLVTLALTGAGTTDAWTGAYTGINGAPLSDASPIYTNTSAQDEQFNVTDPPAGIYAIKAIKIEARAAKSASPTPTKIALGYNSGGSVAVGAAQSLTTAYAVYEQIDSNNPVTAAPWAQADMNALQLNVRSAT